MGQTDTTPTDEELQALPAALTDDQLQALRTAVHEELSARYRRESAPGRVTTAIQEAVGAGIPDDVLQAAIDAARSPSVPDVPGPATPADPDAAADGAAGAPQ